ncbi:MAG TPA: VOC family protein [Ktedonobacteraceae bacterium]|nr:VOC family protein [Ktedonobacteraceae bacterium]
MKIAHAGHVEIRIKDLEASKRFFTETMGLFVTDEDSDTVYLRAWQGWEHHTLTLKRGSTSALDHLGWRVEDAESLKQYARSFDQQGIPYRWIEADVERGQGRALRFSSPSGIPHELYWEIEKFRYKFPINGIAPRRFDHFNVMSNDVAHEQEWLTSVLGIKHRYYVKGENGQRRGSWLSITNLSHDIAVMHNRSGSGGLLHHIAYYVDSPDELLRAATILVEHGGRIEWGPGKHGTSGAVFLYFFEPSGHRIEIWTSDMLIFSPDWEPIRWDQEAEVLGSDIWGTKAPESYLMQGSEIAQQTAETTA